MRVASISILILLLIMILFFVGTIFLQIILSKKKNKFLGLILPIISFVMALTIVIGFYSFSISKSERLESSDGVVLEYTESDISSSGQMSNIITIIFISIFYNIPTIIYLGIYFGYSKHRKELTNKSHDELMKMNIQDLE
jgi:hypothetical protein